MRRSHAFLLSLVLLGITPGAAFAHPELGNASGFVHGFAHPVSGIDHILAMVAVGIFAYQLGGRALWLVPGTFVLVMALGGALGIASIPVPYVEIGIALSIVVLGAIIALDVKAPVAIAMGVVGLFAIFHGHAHGTEMPVDAAGAEYALGFMLATAMLHAAGLAIGFFIGRIGEQRGPLVMRMAGALTALAGVAILAGVL